MVESEATRGSFEASVALYITVLILITERREEELSDAREQLTLELAILGEQKNAKIIALLEEMRIDSPHLRNRYDAEADALSIPADPQAVLDAIRALTTIFMPCQLLLYEAFAQT